MRMRSLGEAIAARWEVVAQCPTIGELVSAARDTLPDLYVVGAAFPDGDGLQTLIQLGQVRPTPAIVVSYDRSVESVAKSLQDHVMAYLMEPVPTEELHAAIIVAATRFAQMRELEGQVGDLRQALADRKIVERAKGILMAKERLSEAEAYTRLRSESQDRRRRLVDIAQDIVSRAERVAEGPTV